MTTRVQPQDKTVTVNGLNLHYIDWGAIGKPTMVLLHGLLSDVHCWDEVAPALCQDYHLLALDQRGRGYSDWASDGDYSIDAYVADLAGFGEALGLEPFILVGHSMGGRNAMAFAARHRDRLSKLVIVGIGPVVPISYQEGISNFLRSAPEEFESFDAVVEWQRKGGLFSFLSEAATRRRLRHSTKELPNGRVGWRYDGAIRDERRRDTVIPPDLWPELGNISCPTLVVRGVNSAPLPADMARRMAEVIPSGQVAEIDRASNMPYDENPDDFIQAIWHFLRS